MNMSTVVSSEMLKPVNYSSGFHFREICSECVRKSTEVGLYLLKTILDPSTVRCFILRVQAETFSVRSDVDVWSVPLPCDGRLRSRDKRPPSSPRRRAKLRHLATPTMHSMTSHDAELLTRRLVSEINWFTHTLIHHGRRRRRRLPRKSPQLLLFRLQPFDCRCDLRFSQHASGEPFATVSMETDVSRCMCSHR